MYYDDQRPPLKASPPPIRTIACLMAVVATAWELCALIGVVRTDLGYPHYHTSEHPGVNAAIFVTVVGYWWRVCRISTYQRRIGMWTLSFIIHGVLLILIAQGTYMSLGAFISAAWWLVALVMSVIACKLEPEETPDDIRPV